MQQLRAPTISIGTLRFSLLITTGLLSSSAGALVAQSNVAFPTEVYAGRRARLVAEVSHPIVILGANMTRRGDFDKQDPNFWYLTGVESPYAIAVIIPDRTGNREVLFLPEMYQFAGAQYPFVDSRLRYTRWNTPIRRLAPGPAAESSTGFDETYPIDEFADRLPGLVGQASQVALIGGGGVSYAPAGLTIETPRAQLARQIGALVTPVPVESAAHVVERMRLIKDEYEIDALRRAAQISAVGLVEAMRTIRPGANDNEIAGAMEYAWKREGSPRAAFAPIVSSGEASISLFTLKSENYNSTDHVMQDGELVFIDYGAAEYLTYGSDVCRTFPVSGQFTDRQRFLYSVVLEAQDSALAHIRPGVMMVDVIRAAAAVYLAHGFDEFENIDAMGVREVWGVMPSPTHYLVQGNDLTPDYSGVRATGVRDLGHHIGIEATDGRDYTGPLQPGMVFTVEPKLYVPNENVAIMIEDVILVTENGYENLSESAPRRIADIERIMGNR